MSNPSKRRVLEENQIDREIRHRTSVARKLCAEHIAPVDRYRQDAQRGKRHEQQLCKACYYFQPIVLGSFEEGPCMTCGGPVVAGPFDDPAARLCPRCSKEHESCRRCMADLELRFQ